MDNSSAGAYISSAEVADILATAPPDANATWLNSLLLRLNTVGICMCLYVDCSCVYKLNVSVSVCVCVCKCVCVCV